MNLYIIYVFKTITYYRADIRGTKSTGEKRRLAWPEMLVVLLPLYWALNIVTNALAYLRAVEGSCGHVLVSVQVNGFQWGWRYCYNDTFYTKILSTPIKTGRESASFLNGPSLFRKCTNKWIRRHGMVYREFDISYNALYVIEHEKEWFLPTFEDTENKLWEFDIENMDNYNLTAEHYYCRQWLKKLGKLENEFDSKVLNKKFQHGYWVVSQGLNPDTGLTVENLNKKTGDIDQVQIKDPLRLLRASGALVLPTRSNIRLMGCSDDITHSWAVPALGIKMDCVPGRLFFFYTNIIREGIYFGQCSELCGWNHYNMPIVLYAVPIEHFIVWWELELQPLFYKRIKSLNNNEKNYKLINYKYK